MAPAGITPSGADWGFEICDFVIWQAKTKPKVSAWDMADPVGWDLGFGALEACWRAVGLGFWGLGLWL